MISSSCRSRRTCRWVSRAGECNTFARGRSDDSIGPYQGAAQSGGDGRAGGTKAARSEIKCRGKSGRYLPRLDDQYRGGVTLDATTLVLIRRNSSSPRAFVRSYQRGGERDE